MHAKRLIEDDLSKAEGIDLLSATESSLLSLVTQVGGYYVERISRRSSKEYDVEFSGEKNLHDYNVRYVAWLPLATIDVALKEADDHMYRTMCLMTDYPDMALEGDWSAFRDSAQETIAELFTVAREVLTKDRGDLHRELGDKLKEDLDIHLRADEVKYGKLERVQATVYIWPNKFVDEDDNLPPVSGLEALALETAQDLRDSGYSAIVTYTDYTEDTEEDAEDTDNCDLRKGYEIWTACPPGTAIAILNDDRLVVRGSASTAVFYNGALCTARDVRRQEAEAAAATADLVNDLGDRLKEARQSILEIVSGPYGVKGQRCVLRGLGQSYLAVVSRNTREGERPWRLTVFDNEYEPLDHFDFDDFTGDLKAVVTEPRFRAWLTDATCINPDTVTLEPA